MECFRRRHCSCQRLLALPLLFFVVFSLSAETIPQFGWVRQVGGITNDYSNCVAVDASNNVYISGSFQGSVNFGITNYSTSNGGDADMWLARFDATGTLQWVKRGGGTGSDAGYGVGVDGSGNVYLASWFSGTAMFDGLQLVSAGVRDIALCKYDQAGNILWARRAGGSYDDIPLRMAVSTSGDSFITGFFRGVADFGSVTITNTANLTNKADMFLAKYDASGNVAWVAHGGSTGDDVSYDVALDTAGNAYVAGYFQGSATFSDTVVSSHGGSDIFVSKYDTNGALVWIKTAGGSLTDLGRGIAVDSAANIFVTGNFQGTATFGTNTFTSHGSDDIFLAKYDSSGNLLWAKQIGGVGDDIGWKTTTDASGAVYVLANFQSTINFGSTNLTALGNTDMFIAKYDGAGNFLWVKQSGSTVGNTLFANSSGTEIYFAGAFSGTASSDGVSLTAGTDDALFGTLVVPPSLSLSRNGSNLVFFWPSTPAGFSLQASSDLNPTNWTTISTGTNTTSTQAVGNANFYRLKFP